MAILVVIYTRWPKSQSQICDIDSEPRDVEGLGQEVDGGRRIELHIGDPSCRRRRDGSESGSGRASSKSNRDSNLDRGLK
jgi:hypothetical protein